MVQFLSWVNWRVLDSELGGKHDCIVALVDVFRCFSALPLRIPGAISKEIFIRIASELAVGVDAVFEAVTVVIACCALVDINALAVVAGVAIFTSWDAVANEWSTAGGFPWCGGGGVWSISCARVFSGAGILSCAGILAVVAIAADAVEATGGVVLASMRVAAVVVGAGHELAS